MNKIRFWLKESESDFHSLLISYSSVNNRARYININSTGKKFTALVFLLSMFQLDLTGEGRAGRLWPTYRHELPWPRQLRSKLDESSLLLTAISKDKAKKESDDDIRPLFPHEVTQARSFVSGVLSESLDVDVVLFTLLDLGGEQLKPENWILESFSKELRVTNSFSEI